MLSIHVLSIKSCWKKQFRVARKKSLQLVVQESVLFIKLNRTTMGIALARCCANTQIFFFLEIFLFRQKPESIIRRVAATSCSIIFNIRKKSFYHDFIKKVDPKKRNVLEVRSNIFYIFYTLHLSSRCCRLDGWWSVKYFLSKNDV